MGMVLIMYIVFQHSQSESDVESSPASVTERYNTGQLLLYGPYCCGPLCLVGLQHLFLLKKKSIYCLTS